MQDLTIIQQQLTNEGLFEVFKQQLAKDFEQSNFSTNFIATLIPNYQNLIETIAKELERSQHKADAHLASLLYRIDISEGQLKKYLHHQKNENPLSVMAQLIVKRILQKVVIRKLYGGSL